MWLILIFSIFVRMIHRKYLLDFANQVLNLYIFWPLNDFCHQIISLAIDLVAVSSVYFPAIAKTDTTKMLFSDFGNDFCTR